MARIVFDLDGTLIHSAPDIHAAVNRLLAAEGIAPLSLPKVTSFIGNGLPVLMDQVIAEVGADPAVKTDWLARLVPDYTARSMDLTAPYPGVEAALADLRYAGHSLAICTNKPEQPTRVILADLGWTGLFPVVIGGDSLPERKPHPAPLRAAANGTTLYVGDSEVDAETAVAAGIPFLLFTGGYRKRPAEELPALARFDRFDVLPALIAANLPPR